jgi:hypothetical protein
MSRYFFHVFNGKAMIDRVGHDLAGMEAVRQEAVRASGQILSNDGYTWKGEAWSMVVVDAADNVVFSTSFSVDPHDR